jgi:hypothetical protein
MSTKTLFVLSTSALFMAIAMPGAALAQFPPPPGPPPALAGPPPGLGAGGPRVWMPAALASVVRQPDLSLAFRAVARQAQLHATWPAVRLVLAVQKDCMVSIAAAAPAFAVSRGALRPTAPTATPTIVTLPMATVIGTELMQRRLWLTAMADPMPPLQTVATT